MTKAFVPALPDKQIYATPRLIRFGLFSHLTASGSGSMIEHSSGVGQASRRS
jgi:hypothetical protein